MKRSIKSNVSKTIIIILLSLAVLVTVFPILFAILSSFKGKEEFLLGGARMLPEVWAWENYVIAWKMANFAIYTMNSVLISAGTVAGAIIISSMAGFTLARLVFPGKKLLVGSFSLTLFISGVVTVYPIFKLCQSLGMTNNLWGMILVQISIGLVVDIFLVTNYCAGISREIDEAARIDGCSFFRTYWSIIMPVIKPILATIGLLEFKNAWNNYLIPLAFTLSNKAIRPLTVGVISLKDSNEGISAWNLMVSGAVMSIVPILIVYLFMNRFFIAGMTEGAVKG
jgi:raffinose/stachyose/melibiose transport system permease protein